MSELLYLSANKPSDDWSWTARYRLPEPQQREDILTKIHRGVQAMPEFGNVEPEHNEEYGLSGTLVGPEGDDDAEWVQDIIFATDPSKRLGPRGTNRMASQQLLSQPLPTTTTRKWSKSYSG